MGALVASFQGGSKARPQLDGVGRFRHLTRRSSKVRRRMRIMLAAGCALLFLACSPSESRGQANSPVEQPPPHGAFAPAFAEQTRAPEQRSGVEVAIEPVASGLDHPWAIAFLSDGRMLVTERAGRLRVVTAEGEVSAPIAGLPNVDARGQGGLLDVAAGPTFSTDRMIYWSFSETRGVLGNGTSVARGRLSEDASRVETVEVIFRQLPSWRSRGHFGSRLVFDREGRLFVTLGDRQGDISRRLVQDNDNHIGKVVRINVDGSVPQDNPFVGVRGVRPEIWSIGHRNVQGAALHPETGALWTVEHGARGGDELNAPRAGLNYGWPIISYGTEYGGDPIGEGIAVREGLEQPIYYWDPVIAPGGMTFYTGELFPWRGDVLIAGLATRALVRLELNGERVVGEERFELGIGRIRDVVEAPDGALWVVTDEDNGGLYRLTPRR
jgi:glucose/arabinose dehydrogenase